MRILRLILVVALGALGLRAQQPVLGVEDPPPSGWTMLVTVDASNNPKYICWARSAQPSHSVTLAAATLTSVVDATTTSTVTTASDHGLAVGNLVTISGALESSKWVAAGITSVVDAANTSTITFGAAHGLDTNDVITLSGFTTDTDLNGTYLFTNTGAATGTITTASVTDDTYNAASDPTMVISLGDTDLNGTYRIQTVPLSTTFTITTANVTDGTYDESAALAYATLAPRKNASVWQVQSLEYDGSNNLIARHWAYGTITSKVFSSAQLFSCADAANLAFR